MSGPYGPNDPGVGRNDPTQQWGAQQNPGGAAPTQHWGAQDPAQAQPTQQWGQQPQAGQPQQPQWGQPQTGAQPQQQWGQSQPQWGQQQPPQQDWGQQQPQPQPQWGQAPQQQWGQGQPPPNQPGSGKGKGLFIALGLLAVVVIGGVVALVVVLTSKDKLDQAAVQTGVEKVLADSYGIQDVSDVSCPAGQEVKVDATFECTLKVSGEQKKVNIKITNENGTYEVGRPS